ncbi:MAG TPA: hypothetical protein VE913_12000 [Longimicrobium sp.]|nr:hypothetical protein [Longimicrobium sp.]
MRSHDGHSHDDAGLRQKIQSILDDGWPVGELAEIGITRALLARLGFRDDRPDLFTGPERAGLVPPPRRPDPGAGSSPDAAEAAFSRGGDAASSYLMGFRATTAWLPRPPPLRRSAGRGASRFR